MPKDFYQTNVNITASDNKKLQYMMYEDGYENRSSFFRWLIRQEYARRFHTPTIAEGAQKGQEKAVNLQETCKGGCRAQ